jgi:hypothetical protein
MPGAAGRAACEFPRSQGPHRREITLRDRLLKASLADRPAAKWNLTDALCRISQMIGQRHLRLSGNLLFTADISVYVRS